MIELKYDKGKQISFTWKIAFTGHLLIEFQASLTSVILLESPNGEFQQLKSIERKPLLIFQKNHQSLVNWKPHNRRTIEMFLQMVFIIHIINCPV